MKMKKHVKFIQGLLLISTVGILLTGCLNKKEVDQHQAQKLSVVIDPVVRQNITVEAELPGRTIASVVAEVRPQVGGIILNQNFTEGRMVEKGDTLYQIDPAIFEASLMEAQAVLARAKANQYAAKMKAERINSLGSSKAISKQDIDDANSMLLQGNAEVIGAEAQVKNAEINLNYTKMLAPISGQIGKSNFTQGALVSPGQTIEMAVIQQLDPMRVDIAYSSAQYAEIQKKIKDGIYSSKKVIDDEGNEVEYHVVRVYLDDDSIYPHEGFIKFSDPTVNQTTGSILLQAEFPNPDRILLPGMFVRTVVEQGIEIGAVSISQRVLTQDLSGRSKVIIARKATPEEIEMMSKAGISVEYVAEERSVVISRAYRGDKWVLSSGLDEGELLVVKGFQMIQMGLQRTPLPFIPVELITTEAYDKGVNTPDDGAIASEEKDPSSKS